MSLRKKFEDWAERMSKKYAPKVDTSKFNHPVAKKTEWAPLKRGGTNICTHILDNSQRNKLIFKPTKGVLIFIGVFTVIGLIALIAPIVILLNQDLKQWSLLFISFSFGGIFTSVSLLMFKNMAQQKVFDIFYSEYYTGKKKPHDLIPNKKNPLISFRDIEALQILREHVRTNKTRYYSYELNFVMKDAKRINIVDHGKINQLREDAKILSMHIGTPVWDATN